MRSRYKEFGLKIDYLEYKHSHTLNKPPMVEEKRDDRVGILSKCCSKKLVRDKGKDDR